MSAQRTTPLRRGGDVLEWHLTENASTGYQWVISVDSGLQIEHDQPEPPAPATPGAAGRHVFRVRAIRPGEWSVHLRLTRSWEGIPLEDRSVRVTVTQ